MVQIFRQEVHAGKRFIFFTTHIYHLRYLLHKISIKIPLRSSLQFTPAVKINNMYQVEIDSGVNRMSQTSKPASI